jgi:NAD(P)-dependent dehydrogenase (short-subunit alcohol dehydrogenase family)
MGKTIVITGANSGIGLALTKVLTQKGNHVIALCRDNPNNKALIENLSKNNKAFGLGKVDFIGINLNNLHSVRQAAHQVINLHQTIDVVICNAGVRDTSYLVTQQKFEQQFQVNYLSQFLLVHLLMPSLNNSTGAKVIFNTSISAEKATINQLDKWMATAVIKESAYDGLLSYRESKFTQMAMSKHMAELFPNILFASVHPGVVNTNLLNRNYGEWFRIASFPFVALAMAIGLVKSAKKATETFVHLVEEPTFESGTYWFNKQQRLPNGILNEKEYLKQIYEQSKKWTGLS